MVIVLLAAIVLLLLGFWRTALAVVIVGGWLLVVSVAAAQERQPIDALVQSSVPYVPPAAYTAWWADVVRDCNCTPKVELTSIWWERVDRPSFDCIEHDRCRGSYIPDLNAAFIAAPDTLREIIVKHEMRHAVLGGDPTHRALLWRSDVVMRMVANGEW